MVLSTAFLNSAGLALLKEPLRLLASRTKIFVGIRNGVTTAQGLLDALSLGCTTIAVDTGSHLRIFHPKVYCSRSPDEARLVIGSANLTFGGLTSNIEFSLQEELLLSDKENAGFVDSIFQSLDRMVDEHPDNVFEIQDADRVQELLDAGRVVDESITRRPGSVGSSRRRDLDQVPRMLLKSAHAPTSKRLGPIKVVIGGAGKVPGAVGGVAKRRQVLVWESKELSRRYLTIPTSEKTNPTGSMLFTKGALEDIDQRHYFRDDVFRGLDWQFDKTAGREHKERATARFQLIIRGVDYGEFELRLSHDPRMDTTTYAQGNSVTQLHWGDARSYTAREDLLGRVMRLYRDSGDETAFVIEID